MILKGEKNGILNSIEGPSESPNRKYENNTLHGQSFNFMMCG